jgi:hypothetical protein
MVPLESAFCAEVVEDQFAMLVQGACDFLHRLDTRIVCAYSASS